MKPEKTDEFRTIEDALQRVREEELEARRKAATSEKISADETPDDAPKDPSSN